MAYVFDAMAALILVDLLTESTQRFLELGSSTGCVLSPNQTLSSIPMNVRLSVRFPFSALATVECESFLHDYFAPPEQRSWVLNAVELYQSRQRLPVAKMSVACVD